MFVKEDRCVWVWLGCIVVGCSKNLFKCIIFFIMLILDMEWLRFMMYEIMKKNCVFEFWLFNIYMGNIILGIIVSCRS